MPIPAKNQLIGLDIGSHAIKLVEIDHGKRGRVLKNFGVIGLPPDAIAEGAIKEMEVVSSALKNLFRNLKIKNKNVATSVSGFSVIVKKIVLDKGAESQLEATIQEQAEQYIPFDINEVNLDFDVLGWGGEDLEDLGSERSSEGPAKMDVVLVAAKKDIIGDYVSLLRTSGLNPGVLDVDAFALQNAFEMSAEVPQGVCALVNVGAEELGINAVKRGASLFTRDSSFGGLQITRAIMSELEVTFEEAEKMKLGAGEVDKKQEKQIKEIFTSVVSGWGQEIKRALDFVASTYPNEAIDKIIVSGGSCRIPGFQKYLESETGIPVSELNPFENLVISEKHFDLKYLDYMAPQAAVAAGLALRSIGDK